MTVDYCIETQTPFHKNVYIHWWERDKHHNLCLNLFNWAGEISRVLEHMSIGRKLLYDMHDQYPVLRGTSLPVLIYDFEEQRWKEPPSEHEMFLALCRKRVYNRLKNQYNAPINQLRKIL